MASLTQPRLPARHFMRPPARGYWLKSTLQVLFALLLLAVAGTVIALRSADGPTQFIAGGELVAGELVTEPVADWSFMHAEMVELQLDITGSSRTTGIMVHNNELYIPCDLGFMWNRLDGGQRWILQLIYWVKDWHEDAVADGRVVIRHDGKKYVRQAVLVEDAALIAELKLGIEDMAREWMAPEPLGTRPAQSPNDIWFFRLDPRSADSVVANGESPDSPLPELEGGRFRVSL